MDLNPFMHSGHRLSNTPYLHPEWRITAMPTLMDITHNATNIPTSLNCIYYSTTAGL